MTVLNKQIIFITVISLLFELTWPTATYFRNNIYFTKDLSKTIFKIEWNVMLAKSKRNLSRFCVELEFHVFTQAARIPLKLTISPMNNISVSETNILALSRKYLLAGERYTSIVRYTRKDRQYQALLMLSLFPIKTTIWARTFTYNITALVFFCRIWIRWNAQQSL